MRDEQRRAANAAARIPNPVVRLCSEDGPEDASVLADSVSGALLVVPDTLPPGQLLAFVLHDLFGLPFVEVAPIAGTTPGAARQLASRARRRIRGAGPATKPNRADRRRVVEAFFTAAHSGDLDAFVELLDPTSCCEPTSDPPGPRSSAEVGRSQIGLCSSQARIGWSRSPRSTPNPVR